MTGPQKMRKPKPTSLGRWVGVAAVVIVWVVVFVGVAVPRLRSAQAKQHEIEDVTLQLAQAGEWISAGKWLERSVADNGIRITDTWNRMFPERRDREGLFLSIAAAADSARIEDLHLTEILDTAMDEDNLWLDRPDGDIQQWMGGEIGGVALDFYRVRAVFRGDLDRVASFLAGIGRIERAVSVHSLDMQPDELGLKVEMKLDVYLSETTGS